MQPLSELLQTALWIGLIVYLVQRYDDLLRSILGEIEARIKKGSNVKVGFVSITDDHPPADSRSQARKLNGEVDEALLQQTDAAVEEVLGFAVEDVPPGYPLPDSFPPGFGAAEPAARYQSADSPGVKAQSSQRQELKTRFALLEELAIRRLQERFDTQILRQVFGPSGIVLDGVFEVAGEVHAVEIKVFPSMARLSMVKHQINSFADKLRSKSSGRQPIVFVLVFENGKERQRIENVRSSLLAELRADIEVVTYLASDLVDQYMQG